VPNNSSTTASIAIRCSRTHALCGRSDRSRRCLRWYWTLYKQGDHRLGDLGVGHEGLSDSARLQRTGLIEIVAFDQSHSLDDFMALPDANGAGTSGENRAVTPRSNIRKKRPDFN
jgi:hypothetical protein